MNKRTRSYIYKITNLINNKVYIGETTCYKNRWKQHKSKNNPIHRPLYKDISLHGIKKFRFEIIYNGSMSKLERVKLENIFIHRYNCFEPKGYNKGPMDKSSRKENIMDNDFEGLSEEQYKTYLNEICHQSEDNYSRYALI